MKTIEIKDLHVNVKTEILKGINLTVKAENSCFVRPNGLGNQPY